MLSIGELDPFNGIKTNDVYGKRSKPLLVLEGKGIIDPCPLWDGKNYKAIGNSFKAEKDLWISAKMGVFCVSEKGVRKGSYADFDWFKVENN